MKLAGALLVLMLPLVIGACASLGPQSCPAGQERLRTAQLFFGHKATPDTRDQPRVSDAEFRRFVEQELTTRFPDGLTVLDGGGPWKGEENRRIREAAKVVLIVLPKTGDGPARITAARDAYKVRFKQDSEMLLTRPECVAL